MIASSRTAALRVLQRVDGGATLASALAAERDRLPDVRDRALVTELATGTIRWRSRLDAAILSFSSRPLTAVAPPLLQVLRLAAYQLLFLDRVPARAVVHDAVDQARACGHAKATGFINGILRALARASDRAAATDDQAVAPNAGAPLGELATHLAHPEWLLARWVARHGREAAQAWARFNNEPAALTLRTNRLRTSREALVASLAEEGVATRPTTFARDGLAVVTGQPIGGAAAAAGLFVLQDEASQLVGEFAAHFVGPRILDTCAAPGGKTLALVAAQHEVLDGNASAPPLVVATDRRTKRVRLLRRTLRAAGAAAVTLAQVDLRRALPFRDVFDLVLVDAPCSGLGTLRRDPDLKWRRTEADLRVLADAQRVMLAVAARTVAPGGHLVYATCSSEPDENEAVVDAFLATTSEFTPAPPPSTLAPGLSRVIDADGRLRTAPHAHQLEAFFAVALRRKR